MRIYCDQEARSLGSIKCDECGISVAPPTRTVNRVDPMLRKMGWRIVNCKREKEPVRLDLCPECIHKLTVCPHCGGITKDSSYVTFEFRCRNCRKWIGQTNGRGTATPIPLFRSGRLGGHPFVAGSYIIVMPGDRGGNRQFRIPFYDVARLINSRRAISLLKFERWLKTRDAQIAVAKLLKERDPDIFKEILEPTISDYLGVDWDDDRGAL